jgi:hypothetical protein
VPESPYPLPIGYVGDIEFWQPNRGLLITAGNSVVSPGLYAYNGVAWHQLSTVCGGTDGRIAWAGPDEFWTISDQRPGQTLPTGGTGALQDISLCHFKNGQVVTSYALPLDQPNSYHPMNAAACDSASDCWFGGQLDSKGAFHLHWNGSTMTVVDGSADHEIASMAVDDGQIFESVQLEPSDSYGLESRANPPLLHQIAPSDPAAPFHDLYPPDNQDPGCGSFCPPLPEYGADSDGNPVAANTLGGLALGSDWRADPSDPELWAAAGPDGTPPPPGGASAHGVVLRYAHGTWLQVVPNLAQLPGDDEPLGYQGATPAAESVAPEPGESSAWIAVVSTSNADSEAHVVRIAMTGPRSARITDVQALGTAQAVGPRGPASAITCPAPHDCWLATHQGWLFHLTSGTKLPRDTDRNFAGVITYRPTDAGVPQAIPSGQYTGGVIPPTTLTHHPRPPLVSHIGKARLVHRTTLILSFRLTGRAKVRLLARRHKKVVASSKRMVFGPGQHKLKIVLNPHRWPTRLSLVAVSVKHHGRA